MALESSPPTPQQLPRWIAERLRLAILEGRVKPGAWLRQEKLAQEYGVSQMPVREALKQLAAEGLVEHIPYRGVRVVIFTREDIQDLYACRAFLEGMAARWAARNVTAADLDELRTLQDRMRDCGGPSRLGEYRLLNRRFHSLVFAASRRAYLVRTLAQLWEAFPTMLWSNFPQTASGASPEREVSDLAEHDAIVAALESHDPDAAERAVRLHIEEAARQLEATLRKEG